MFSPKSVANLPHPARMNCHGFAKSVAALCERRI
jgi:hypothetical protein